MDEPAWWGDYQGWVLAGHTHGGQCKAPFLPPPLLPVKNARYAAEKGVLVPINPDAHSTSSLDHVQWGVRVARKGWLGPRNVLNAYELEEVEEIFAKRKQGRAP